MSTPRLQTGLSGEQSCGVVGLLNRLLADEYLLYTKLRNFHWNVVGPDFPQLHRLFEEQYEQVDDAIDEIAERARAVGGLAEGTLAGFLKLTRLTEAGSPLPDARGMVAELLADHEAIIRSLRTDLVDAGEKWGDAGTNDFLTGLMERHEKMAWMLRATLG